RRSSSRSSTPRRSPRRSRADPEDRTIVSTPPVLAVEQVSLQIGGARIINDVSLQVAEGEMLGVIGPNGAGKTTLFNLVSGVLRPTAGAIRLADRDVTRSTVDARARAGLGRSFQTSNLFLGLTVLENARLAAQAARGGSLSPFRFP